ncbi:hypothetical protein HYU09_00745 [Candidatus Woesearchaeota archaeon]|nr:hypothetical protein [Candidatus Woesearchaeota archaeon]
MFKKFGWIIALFLLVPTALGAGESEICTFNETCTLFKTDQGTTYTANGSALYAGDQKFYINSTFIKDANTTSEQFEIIMNYSSEIDPGWAPYFMIYTTDACAALADNWKVYHVNQDDVNYIPKYIRDPADGNPSADAFIPSQVWQKIKLRYNQTSTNASLFTWDDDIGIWIFNASIAGVSRAGAVDCVALKDPRGGNANWDTWVSYLEVVNISEAGAVADTTPPEINFYNMTSDGGLGCTVWNTNKQNPCITTDKTPTVKINLSEPSFCAISTLNLNYTAMIANDSLTNCTGAPGNSLTCILSASKEATAPGLFNVSIGCKDEAGNENSTSTSGRLLLNITDLTPPIVALEKPEVDTTLFFKNRPFTFNFTATDNFGLLDMSCSLYFNNTLNQTNSSVANGTLTNFNPVNLSRNTWQWNVSCTDDSGNVNSSARIAIINNTKPTAPALQTPANNSGFGNLPEFTWNNSIDDDDVDIITYTIEVNNQSGFDGNMAFSKSDTAEDADGITGINITLPSADEDAYFWRVTAFDGFENTSVSNIFQFAYANWTIKFNLTDSGTGKQIDTSAGNSHFDVSCSNGYTATNVENPHTATNAFSLGLHNCTFSDLISGDTYRSNTIAFTANADKTIEVTMSITGGLTEEEHIWLESLYTCFTTGECIDLLRNINETTTNTWKRVTGTDTSVVTSEIITSSTLSSTSNISIDYTIDIPTKAGYAVGELLPLRMFFWITDVNKTKCFNQDKASDTNRAEAPYCLPLTAETLGPNGGQVNFTVDLRPNVPDGEYNITRSIEIDPIVNNIVTWINYGQENIGQIKVLESGSADLFLLKTGESAPVRAAAGITGAAIALTQLSPTMIGAIAILFILVIGLSGYIIYSKNKK